MPEVAADTSTTEVGQVTGITAIPSTSNEKAHTPETRNAETHDKAPAGKQDEAPIQKTMVINIGKKRFKLVEVPDEKNDVKTDEEKIEAILTTPKPKPLTNMTGC